LLDRVDHRKEKASMPFYGVDAFLRLTVAAAPLPPLDYFGDQPKQQSDKGDEVANFHDEPSLM
jgi:hypothetical protein